MRESFVALWRRTTAVLAPFALALLAACGGGISSTSSSAGLAMGDSSDLKAMIAAVPAGGGADRHDDP